MKRALEGKGQVMGSPELKSGVDQGARGGWSVKLRFSQIWEGAVSQESTEHSGNSDGIHLKTQGTRVKEILRASLGGSQHMNLDQ